MEKRRILVIAGSDSSGGAGLEADQKVIAAHQCYAMTATTALTAQNTLGVRAIHHTPPDFVVKQIDACINDIGVDIVKIGMLASAETVDAVAGALKRHGAPTSVVDPVMLATSGAQLLPNPAITNLRSHILPLTTILTPNIPEALLLLSNASIPAPTITSLSDIIAVAALVQSLGPKYVLVKGGHLPLKKDGTIATQEEEKSVVADVLHDGRESTVLKTGFLPSGNTHGTGCSLASAIAANLALGKTIQEAVKNAVRYVEVGIRTAPDLGGGSGPINHFHGEINGGGR